MSGRGDDKSIEPAHQPPLSEILRRQCVEERGERALTELERELGHWIARVESEGQALALRVGAVESDFGSLRERHDGLRRRVEAEVQRLALRLSDAEDQWRRTRARHEAMSRKTEALGDCVTELALAASIGDADHVKRTGDDVLVRMRTDLASALEKAKGHVMTDEELKAQRASYVRGEMGLGSDRGEAAYQAEQEAAPARPAEVVTTPLRVGAAPRATGWAVVLDSDLVLAGRVSFVRKMDARAAVRWLGSRDDAETLARLLGTGRAAELDRVTLEEVG